jgi:hypothetical protein
MDGVIPRVDHHDHHEDPHRDDGESERHGETTHDDPLTGTNASRRSDGSAGTTKQGWFPSWLFSSRGQARWARDSRCVSGERAR